jgi:hypothetical protein
MNQKARYSNTNSEIGRSQIKYAGTRLSGPKQKKDILDSCRRHKLTTSRLARVAYIAMNPA